MLVPVIEQHYFALTALCVILFVFYFAFIRPSKLEGDWERFLVIVFGIGFVMLPINNPTLSSWLTPFTGLTLILATLPYLVHWRQIVRERIPIAVLVIIVSVMLSMGVSGKLMLLNSRQLASGILAPFAYAVLILCVYHVIRNHKGILEKPAMVLLITASVGVVTDACITGLKGAGWVAPMNYDVIAPVLLIALLLSPSAERWWLSGIAVAGLFFSGSEYGLLAIIVFALIFVIKRKWSRKMLLPVGILAACFLVATPPGLTFSIWIHNGVQFTLGDRVVALTQWMGGTPYHEVDIYISGNRLLSDWQAARPLSLFGYGWNTGANPANQFLIMADQVGVIAALAWLWASITWGHKNHRYDVLVVLLVIGLLDPFFWMVGHLWWFGIMALNDTQKATTITAPATQRAQPKGNIFSLISRFD